MSALQYRTTTAGADWEHGLTAGNGSVGALLSGTPGRHEITLAHERVVLPTDPPRAAPDLAADLPLIRELIDSGRAQEAADLGVQRSKEQGYPGLQWTDPLVPSLTIAIETDDEADAAGYRRDVDLDADLATVAWTAGGADRSIAMFVSRADGILVARLRGFGSAPTVRAEAPQNIVTTASGVKGGNADKVTFAHATDGGVQRVGLRFHADWNLDVLGADSAVTVRPDGDDLLILAATRPVRRGTAEPADALGAGREDLGFDALHARHRDALARDVHVVTLTLGESGANDAQGERPTEDLFADDTPAARDRLLALEHRSAQRLIAASTGELAPTLQGVWSGTFDPAWSSDYTMNGNVQSGSIASMLSTGNPAQLRTFLDMLEGFTDDFRDNAQRLFGARGYVLPSRCSPTHGACTHFDEKHCHEFWTAGGAWAAMFFFDYVWYTGDLDYLREHAYPFAREVERFYEDFLLWGDGGRIVFSPSYSPENRSPSFDSQACRNATMDRAVLAGLLTGLQRAAALLGVDDDLAEQRRVWAESLPPYRVAPDGTLAEWLDDGIREDLGHRTASHLLGTWFEADRDLVESHREPIRRLIAEKLRWRASGGNREEMAYGLTQLGIAASAIGDADLALECVDRMSRKYFLPSLSSTHDVGAIFNVDIAGGMPEVVHSMLVDSRIDSLALLPALPARWGEGRIDGLHARGGIVVERLAWTPERIALRARTLPGARALRGGAPLTVTAPAGWSLRGADAASPGVWTADVEDGAEFVVEAQR